MDNIANTKKMITLDCLEVGKKGTVYALTANGNERRRMLDLGIVKGTTVYPLMQSPFGDPTAYLIRGTVIALRRKDAANIFLYKEQ